MESVIKTLREQNRYTQVKLAKELGISRQALIKYESMEQELPVNVIRCLSRIFSVSYECFIDNKLPSPDIAEDEAMLKQLTRDFTKLNASEKKAVLEMTRIMANA